MTTQRLPIGTSDFRKIFEDNGYYVDKTTFIKKVVDSSSETLLFPRPRRFGKTLNLSMLRHFFEKSDENAGALFDGLAIRSAGAFERHQGKYPVIYLTFKDLKALSRDALFIHISMLCRKSSPGMNTC